MHPPLKNLALGSVACLLLGFVSCEKPEVKNTVSSDSEGTAEVSEVREEIPETGEQPKVERVTLPVDRVLTDSKGRKLDATIVGRSQMHLTVVRKIDKSRFELPISSLAPEDRIFAKALAFHTEEVPYIKTRNEEIARLEERILRLEAEVENSTNPILKKSQESQIKDAEKEVAKLKSDIEFHQPR